MTDAISVAIPSALSSDTARDAGLTPAGLQSRRTLAWRRALVGALVLATVAALGAGVASVLGTGGWGWADVIIMACFLIGAPWTVMGMWNAVLGLWLLHRRGGLAAACPVVDDGLTDDPVSGRVAVLMCLRNEDPWRALARLAAVRRSLDGTGQGHAFTFFVLSDTDEPGVADAEAAAFDVYREALGPGAIYRRRARNTGYKAGNIGDFLRRWGRDFTYFVPLDSDSVMGGEAILRLTRTIQRHPRLGILQALSVGTPSASPFARLFQFGMRHGMRSHTAGAIWWHGDACGYWGHNAVIRTAPFRARCRVPTLPGKPPLGGTILSHDQIEAALMRRAGYECRILPVEVESFEDNPPTVLDFIKRDHRWCNGNMQYLRLLGLPGAAAMSRFQIFAAIAMYFGGPAWMLMILAAAMLAASGPAGGQVDLVLGIAMFFIMFSVSLVPKVAGWIDVALTRGGMARYGGRRRFAAGALAETAFSMLLAPVSALAVTIFMGGLFMGRTITWSGQQRDLTRVSWAQAWRSMWPQTLFGVALTAWLASTAPGALPWAAPALAGLLLAAPMAVATASPRLGGWMAAVGLCATPEEGAGVAVLQDVASPRLPETRPRAA
jgi:membrane glycosyltransferase